MQEMMRWQWHPLDHMQIIGTSLQTDNHTTTSPLSFFTAWMPFLPPNQQHQSTEGTYNRLVKLRHSEYVPDHFQSLVNSSLVLKLPVLQIS